MKVKELGHIVLYVTDIEKLSSFYRDVLGFEQIGSKDGLTAFSSGRTHHELLLIQVGGRKREPHQIEPGLYHFGLKIGDTQEELKEAIKELEEKKVEIVGTADHYVTNSVYIIDPDGNEIELYVDSSDEWKKDPKVVLERPKELRL